MTIFIDRNLMVEMCYFLVLPFSVSFFFPQIFPTRYSGSIFCELVLNLNAVQDLPLNFMFYVK